MLFGYLNRLHSLLFRLLGLSVALSLAVANSLVLLATEAELTSVGAEGTATDAATAKQDGEDDDDDNAGSDGAR